MILRTRTKRLPVALVIAVAVLALAPFAGMKFISPFTLGANLFDLSVLVSLRIPRVLAAFLAGSGLAICGLTFQALFRNPLADPFTLGIASGASCGAAVTILLGVGGAVAGIPIISIGAFAGAALSMLLVYGIASIRRSSSGVTMLLAGISVSFLFSSVLMFMQYLSSLRDSFQIIRWLMGGIEVFGYGSVLTMLPCMAVGTVLIFMKLPELDHLLVGEDLAHSRGVDVVLTKRVLLVAATLIVGSIVSVCGPIGFVGMMIPHICKLLFRMNHRILGPASFVLGGAFLVICDTVARVVIAPAEIPVGVITALLGGPFFLWILFSRKNGGFA